MSSIGGINSSSDIIQLLQQLARQQAEEENTTLLGLQGSSGSQRAGFESQLSQALKEMGLSDDEVSTIQEEIQAAIDQIEASSDGTTDMGEAIRNAIDETLQNHGVDTDELNSQMQPPQNGMSMMAAAGSSQSNDGILAQLGYTTSTDESSYQWLLSLLPLMDEQA